MGEGTDISDKSYSSTEYTVPQGQGQVEKTDETKKTESASSAPAASSESTISRSELADLERLMLLAAGFPILIRPMDNSGFAGKAVAEGVSAVSAAALSIDFESKKNDIILSMWDKYMDDLDKLKEDTRRDEIKAWLEEKVVNPPTNAQEYLTYAIVSSTVTTVAGSVANAAVAGVDGTQSTLQSKFADTFKEWLTPSEAVAVGEDYPGSNFIAGALASNSDIFTGTISPLTLVLDYKITTSPVADALFAVGPTSGLPMDTQAAAAMIAALLNGGAVAKATTETIQESAGGKPIRDLDFAQNYANNILSIVKAPKEGEAANPMRAKENQFIRLMLCTMALNLVYRAAYGGMTGEELEDLLNGNTDDLPEEIKPQMEDLVTLINSYLPKDPAARAESLKQLKEYVDTKHSVDTMLQDTNNYSEMIKSSADVEENRTIISD